MTAQVQRGIEPGIYIHFIMHAYSMLREGGRLGMIISDSWLQTDYGVDFGRFLLDHFKVKALIDISARVFPVPLIGTCIILLENAPTRRNVRRIKRSSCMRTYRKQRRSRSMKSWKPLRNRRNMGIDILSES
ncbi:MAG: Eco57I restriction-modification methylase domain-containing protein [Candidatus Bathyarchaeia archaeon]